jgi:MFS transporter, ACS family, D-galactonate transporter
MAREERLSPAMWRLLVLLMLSAVINYVDRGSLSTAAPLLQDELRLNPSQLGILFSSFFCAYAACMLAAGWLADHLNVNWVLAAGFFLWCAATVATGFAYGFAALFAARLVLGMGESVSFPCYSTLLARHFSNQRRGIANAVLVTGMAIGTAVGMFTGGELMARFGWRLVFIGLGLVGMLWLPAWLKWMPRESSASKSRHEPPSPGIPEILKQRSVWGTCMGYGSQCYLWYLLLTWAPYYLVRARHYSMTGMAKIAGAAYLCNALCSMVSGWLSDRWIEAGGSQTLVRKTIAATGLASAGIFLLLCPLVGRTASVVCLLLAFASYGCFIGHTWAMIQTLAGPRASGKWFAIANSFGSVAGILAPSVTGFLVNRTGSFVWPLGLTALIAVFGSICWVFVLGPVKQVAWLEKVAAPADKAVTIAVESA